MFFDSEHFQYLGDAPALIGEDGTTISYLDLDARAATFAERLSHGRGLLALRAANTVECIAAYVGALRAKCPVLFESTGPRPFPCLYRYDSVSDVLDVDPTAAHLALHDDLALLLSTSGSTGAAKSVRLSYANLDSNADAIVEYLGLGSKDRAPTNLPLHYSYGLSILNSHLAAGGALLLTDRTVLDPDFWSAFAAANCTGFAGVPHTYELLDKSPMREAALPTLRYATQAGGKLAPERVASWAARAAKGNWQFFVMYGQTEAAPRMAYLPPELAQTHPDCIGHAIPQGRFRLLDDAGNEILAPGETGELIYEGPNVMMGYATKIEDLAEPPTYQSLHTGDMALRTPEGLYRIVGRRSRFIKPFGLRISMEEVEARLEGQGLSVACSAGPQESLWVLIAGEDSVDLNAVRADLGQWLGVPSSVLHVHAVADIPRRESGKTDTSAVARLVASLIAAHEEANDADPRDTSGADGAPPVDAAEAIAAIFLAKFGDVARDRTVSYQRLEGDSLSYIDMMLQLERHIPNLPDDWDALSINALGAAAAEGSRRDVEDIFVAAFGDDARDAGASFESLGADDAQAAKLERELKAHFAPLPDDWRHMSIGALSSLTAERSTATEGKRKIGYRPSNLDAVRGLACILIVALHVVGARGEQGLEIPRPSLWHGVMDALEVVRLPLFTAMSGYIYGAMPATRDGFWPYMRTKLKQLAIPLLFATAFFWSVKNFVLNEPGRGLVATYVHGYEHLWYIYSILLMFACVALLDQFLRPKVRLWVILIAAFMVIYRLIPVDVIPYVKTGVLLLPFFLFGIVIQRRSDWMKSPITRLIALILLIGSVASVPLGQPEAVGLDEAGLVTWLGGGSAVILLLLYVPRIAGLELLAAYSFTIYLWHPAASAATRMLLWKLGVQSTPLLFVAGLTVGLAAPVIMHLVALRLPKLLSMPVIGK